MLEGDDEQSVGSLCCHESGLLPTREDQMVAVSLERVKPTPEGEKAEARLKNRKVEKRSGLTVGGPSFRSHFGIRRERREKNKVESRS